MSWETTRGLLSEYVGTVTAARFKFDPRYQDGSVLLCEWDMSTDNADTPSVTERFSCGSGWTTEDGDSAFRKDGSDKFQESSIYGHIIETVKADEAAIAALEDRGDPVNAALWVGTRWRCEHVVLNFGKDSDGEPITSARVMPVEFLGVDEEGGAAAPNPSDNGELMEKLGVIAKSSDNHGDFVSKALKLDGSEALINQIADDGDNGLYEKLKS